MMSGTSTARPPSNASSGDSGSRSPSTTGAVGIVPGWSPILSRRMRAAASSSAGGGGGGARLVGGGGGEAPGRVLVGTRGRDDPRGPAPRPLLAEHHARRRALGD